MTLKDYHVGTAYLTLWRHDFKSEQRFVDYCRFLCIPESVGKIVIEISNSQHLELMRKDGAENG